MSRTKVTPKEGNKRNDLRKLATIKIQGNKQVPVVLRAIFSNYDKDASGSISQKEMADLVLECQSLLPGTPKHLKHCSQTVAKIAMAALDLDKGGTIDEEEFVEWCTSNLFLSAEDRNAMLVSNMDLSQFITALEMCVKMQLAGIGPFDYYTPPEPTCASKYCTKKICCRFLVIFLFLTFVGAAVVFFIFIEPTLGDKASSTSSTSPASGASTTGGTGTGTGSSPSPASGARLLRGTAEDIVRLLM